jgi:hypothetical protein
VNTNPTLWARTAEVTRCSLSGEKLSATTFPAGHRLRSCLRKSKDSRQRLQSRNLKNIWPEARSNAADLCRTPRCGIGIRKPGGTGVREPALAPNGGLGVQWPRTRQRSSPIRRWRMVVPVENPDRRRCEVRTFRTPPRLGRLPCDPCASCGATSGSHSRTNTPASRAIAHLQPHPPGTSHQKHKRPPLQQQRFSASHQRW